MKVTLDFLPGSVKVRTTLGNEKLDDVHPTLSVRDKAAFLSWLNEWAFYGGSQYDREMVHIAVRHGDKVECEGCEICKR